MTKFSAPQQNQLAQIGAFLREHREKQGKSLEDIAIRTYIRPQLLNGIETGDPDLLPEPIFVQGFIRRYGESLGLNGIELSQQFTVTSVPSTPRPAHQASPDDSTTTRLTRFSASQPPSNGAIADNIPVFSADNLSNAPLTSNTAEDLTLGRPDVKPEVTEIKPAAKPKVNPVVETETALDQDLIDQGFISERALDRADDPFNSTVNHISADIPATSSATNSFVTPADADFDGESDSELESELERRLNETNGTVAEPTETSFDSLGLGTTAAASSEASIPDASTLEADFASQVAASNQANFNQRHVSSDDLHESAPSEPDSLPIDSLPIDSLPIAESTALNSQAALDNAQANTSFDDDLPAAFTTEASPLPPDASGEPVGVEYDRQDQPNLKPFIIGGVVAAIATGAIILASILGGGGNRQPSVASSPATSGETTQDANTLPAIPAETAPSAAAKPPVSTAPVYVETTATDEAWVSIITDGTTIFEGTLQPGESKVWEAQESINIYSANAGGIEVAVNGGKAEIMGQPGQLAEKTFTQ